MMKQITMLEALKHTSPHPVSLVCVQTPEGKTNLTTVSWWTYLENDPPIVGFSMWNKSYTCELLAKIGKAVLSIPGDAIADATLKCGTVSGRNVDKPAEYGIEMVDTAIKYPMHSRLAFMCSVDQKIEIGDCIFFICNITDIFCNENEKQIFVWSDSKNLAPVHQAQKNG